MVDFCHFPGWLAILNSAAYGLPSKIVCFSDFFQKADGINSVLDAECRKPQI